MNIGILGNCQVRTIGSCLKELMPDSEIKILWTNQSKSDEQFSFFENNSPFDLIIYHSSAISPALELKNMACQSSLLSIPPIAFNGSQPDNVVFPNIIGPLGLNHSIIIAASFVAGLNEIRCRSLFNSYIYAALGYFERFDLDRERLLHSARKTDLALDDVFQKWGAHFMFDIFHPKLEPLASVAEEIYLRLGNSIPREGWCRSIDHEFGEKRFYMWPVYPEIAKHIGVQAEEINFGASIAGSNLMSLEEMIKRSFYTYSRLSQEGLREIEIKIDKEVKIIKESLVS